MALKAYVTTAGAAVLNYLLANQGTLTFVRADLGSGHEDNATACRALTAVKTKVTEAQFVAATLNNGNARVSVQYDNASLATGFSLNEIGLFVTDPQTSNPVLYCYITFEGDADVIAPGATASYIRVWDIVTPVSTLATVSATISSSAYATTGQLATQGLPTGGSQGQVLVKSSATDYASSWQTLPSATDSATGLMTSTDHAKLTGIASGAEVNQNAFANVKVGSVTVAADAKQDTLELAAGNDMTLTPDATNDKVTFTHSNSGVTAASKGDTSNQTPGFGGTFKVPSGTVNARGHLTAFADHTVTIPSAAATTSAAGLMSAADKTKLNGIATGANAYTHPGYTQRNTGLYKVHVDSIGHVDSVTSVTKADITALGIPSTNTTYSNATQSTAGLMSASDKAALDNDCVRTKTTPGVNTLDSITAPGVYFVRRTSDGIVNGWPDDYNTSTTANTYAMLEVLYFQGSNITTWVQRLTTVYLSNTRMYVRSRYGSTWRDWMRAEMYSPIDGSSSGPSTPT